MIRLVHPLKKSVIASADFSSAEAISVEESAREIASSCLLAMTVFLNKAVVLNLIQDLR